MNIFHNSTIIMEALSLDDVLLVPGKSLLLPDDQISTETFLTKKIKIKTPFISAAMDTVTGHQMAIELARNGGLGIIHRNSSVEEQCRSVEYVKRHQSSMVKNPYTLKPNDTLEKVIEIYNEFNFTTIPVTDNSSKLLGLITERHIEDYKNNLKVKLSTIMVPFSEIVVAYGDTDVGAAHEIMKKKGKSRLPIIKSKKDKTLIGLYFKKDYDNISKFPNMSIDEKGRLLVGAAIGVGSDGFLRAQALIKAGVDVLCVDTAQGHSVGVIDIVKRIKLDYPKIQIIAGNVVTAQGARDLIEAGADAIKVGVGPGAICTTREMTGNGMPQFTAVLLVSQVTRAEGVPLISDGGIKSPGDIPKIIAAGADSVMMGSVFSGTDEAPGEIVTRSNGKFKIYRGMGSPEAMSVGISKDRYGLSGSFKKIAEGVSGLVPYKGSVQKVIDEYQGALVQSMRVYQGSKTIKELQTNPVFVKQTQQGKIESGTRVIMP
jgi:IMP dehydrogenase